MDALFPIEFTSAIATARFSAGEEMMLGTQVRTSAQAP